MKEVFEMNEQMIICYSIFAIVFVLLVIIVVDYLKKDDGIQTTDALCPYSSSGEDFGHWLSNNGWIIDPSDFKMWLNFEKMKCAYTDDLYMDYLKWKKLNK